MGVGIGALALSASSCSQAYLCFPPRVPNVLCQLPLPTPFPCPTLALTPAPTCWALGPLPLVEPSPHSPGPSLSQGPEPHFLILALSSAFSTFKHLWKQVAQNLDRFRTFPRLAGGEGPFSLVPSLWLPGTPP